MCIRLLATSAVIVLIAGPAFADCNQAIEALKEAVTQAETGASSAETGLPATQHQEQVLADKRSGESAGAGSAGQVEVPVSPHQREVIAETQTAEADAGAGQQPGELIAQAGDIAEAGDEEGCMQKVAQAKNLLGID
jgi:hypothetical protein